MRNKIIVTGAAGFIGFHVCKKLIELGQDILGIDNINSYYETEIKKARISEIAKKAKNSDEIWEFVKVDLEEKETLRTIFKRFQPNIVVNLAAQAGVRFSITNPDSYVKSNLVGFVNIIELCRNFNVGHLIYASSSSVYGGNSKTPFHENDPVNHPVSLYAATKRSNELIAHVYSHLYQIPCTGLRLFTVYGPWGRPDMAPMKFAKAIFARKPIHVFNRGEMIRDFTYVDDVVNCMIELINKPATPDNNFNPEKPQPAISWAPHRIFNIGNQDPIPLMQFIKTLEEEIGISAIKSFEDMQDGDVEVTHSSGDLMQEWINYKPNTPLKEGIHEFINWYKEYNELT